MKNLTLAVLLLAAAASQAMAYGPEGHKLVGAIADKCVKQSTTDSIQKMLEGLSLQQAATIPDQIKEWDQDPPEAGKTFLRHQPKLEKQMIAFHKANPHRKGSPSDHRSFHFTDVPVVGDEKYADGSVGRSSTDIVQMIKFCIKVLQETEPEDNPKKITKPVAVVLLSHYVGDIHQPLHVGAEYFDAGATPVNPDKTAGARPDTGGNAVMLVLEHLSTHGHGHGAHNPDLHGYWDDNAVTTAMAVQRKALGNGAATLDEIAKSFAQNKPDGLDDDAALKPTELSEAWANEILPIARDAHARLEFTAIVLQQPSAAAAAMHAARGPQWMATEKNPGTYADFAGATVGKEIHKGGWRLANLLDQVL